MLSGLQRYLFFNYYRYEISLNIFQQIVNVNKWIIIGTLEILYFVFFGTFSQLSVYIVVDKSQLNMSTLL